VTSKIFPWVPYIGHSQSMEPIIFTVPSKTGVTRLRIPKAYLTWKPDWEGKTDKTIAIEAMLPDMQPSEIVRPKRIKPLMQKGMTEYEARSHTFEDEIHITLWEGHLNTIKWIGDDLLKACPVHETVDYELVRISNANKPSSGRCSSKVQGHNLYVGKWESTYVKIKCPKTGACRLDSEFNDQISLSYSFGRTRLSEWQDIHQRVRSFVASLTINDHGN
jgi:hypothetical protein